MTSPLDIVREIEEICRSFAAGESSGKKFSDSFWRLWPIYRDSDVAKSSNAGWIERVMTATDCFQYPDERINLNEEQLRAEILKYMDKTF